MSKKKKDRAKDQEHIKWLISRETTKKKRIKVSANDYDGYSVAHPKQRLYLFPNRESMVNSCKNHRAPVNTKLLKEFLATVVGEDWDNIRPEIIYRIPSKLRDYVYVISWYVVEQAEIRDGKLWDMKEDTMIPQHSDVNFSTWKKNNKRLQYYVDPETNKMLNIDSFYKQ